MGWDGDVLIRPNKEFADDAPNGPCCKECLCKYGWHIESVNEGLIELAREVEVDSVAFQHFSYLFLWKDTSDPSQFADLMASICKTKFARYSYAEIIVAIRKYIAPTSPDVAKRLIKMMEPFSKTEVRLDCYRRGKPITNENLWYPFDDEKMCKLIEDTWNHLEKESKVPREMKLFLQNADRDELSRFNWLLNHKYKDEDPRIFGRVKGVFPMYYSGNL